MSEFFSNMRQNRDHRLNPLSYGGNSYSKDENKTAVSALSDLGLYAIEPAPMGTFIGGEWRPSDYRELYRSPMPDDNDYRSFGVVGKDYIPVQPETFAYLWDRHLRDDSGNSVPVTSLRMDRWGERLIFSHEIKKYEVKAHGDRRVGDEMGSYMVLDVPFTPSVAISLSSFTLRLACLNGATRQDAKMSFRVPHLGKPEETLQEMLLMIYAYSKNQADLDESVFNSLAKKLLNPVEINWILNAAYPMSRRPVNETHPRYTAMVETWEKERAKVSGFKKDVLTLYNGAGIGADLPTMQNTAFGLVQAISQFEGDRRTSSFASATADMLSGGGRASTISRALSTATGIANGAIHPAALEEEAVIVR